MSNFMEGKKIKCPSCSKMLGVKKGGEFTTKVKNNNTITITVGNSFTIECQCSMKITYSGIRSIMYEQKLVEKTSV